MLSPKQIRGAHLNETAYPKGALIRTRTLIKKKTNSMGALIGHSTQNFTLLKGIQSFLSHGRFVPSRFVSKFSPFIPSLSQIVPEMLHVRLHEQISVVRLFPRATSKWSKVSKIPAKFCCVYL